MTRLAVWGLVALVTVAPARAQEPDLFPGPDLRAVAEPAFLLSLPWLEPPGTDLDEARVLGAEREGVTSDRSLTTWDRVFLPLVVGGRRLVPGDAVQFYRVGHAAEDPETRERLGRVAVPSAVAVVDSLAGDVSRALVTDAFAPVLVGDLARTVTEADSTWAPAPDPRPIGAEGLVVAFQVEKATVPPLDRLFVRRTAGPPPAPGDRLLLYRPGPIREGRRLPDLVMGWALVVRTQGDVALAVLIEADRSDLSVGDLFREVSPDPED